MIKRYEIGIQHGAMPDGSSCMWVDIFPSDNDELEGANIAIVSANKIKLNDKDDSIVEYLQDIGILREIITAFDELSFA